MWTVMDLELAGVPHHFGFCTSVIACGVTEPSLKGPPDRSMAGSTVVQDGFQPDLLHHVRRQQVGEEHLASRRRGS